jgi:hypothetical protein
VEKEKIVEYMIYINGNRHAIVPESSLLETIRILRDFITNGEITVEKEKK